MYSAYQPDYWQVGAITQFELPCFSRCSIQRQLALVHAGDGGVQPGFLPPSELQLLLYTPQRSRLISRRKVL